MQFYMAMYGMVLMMCLLLRCAPILLGKGGEEMKLNLLKVCDRVCLSLDDLDDLDDL